MQARNRLVNAVVGTFQLRGHKDLGSIDSRTGDPSRDIDFVPVERRRIDDSLAEVEGRRHRRLRFRVVHQMRSDTEDRNAPSATKSSGGYWQHALHLREWWSTASVVFASSNILGERRDLAGWD